MVTAFHAKEPQKLQEKLVEAIGQKPVHAYEFKVGLAKLADMMGSKEMAARMRRRARSRELSKVHGKGARA